MLKISAKASKEITMGPTYRTVLVDGLKVFYREAGDLHAPAVLLLHGFPTSSHMYRDLIPALADCYHVMAPDLPGFGFTEAPNRSDFKYTFDHLAAVTERFTEVLELNQYALYVFDYGAPVGFRLAIHHPERITALISQNGNAYIEGLSEGWNPIQTYWKDPSPENRAALRAFLKPEMTQWQYTHGVAQPERLSPDAWTLDSALLARPDNDEIQLDLFGDYQSNVALYPQFQAYIRTHRPPLLAVWGKNDPFFLPAGAEAFKRDNSDAEIHLLDAGHFALESQGPEIASIICDFLNRKLPKQVATPGPGTIRFVAMNGTS
jgi:pimeloyl-ACP methyl ester carboxylesterase